MEWPKQPFKRRVTGIFRNDKKCPHCAKGNQERECPSLKGKKKASPVVSNAVVSGTNVQLHNDKI